MVYQYQILCALQIPFNQLLILSQKPNSLVPQIMRSTNAFCFKFCRLSINFSWLNIFTQILDFQTTRALLTSNCGRFLTNETICELLQCCFRIGLESGLPILLRQIAESVLIDMTRLLHISLTSFDRDIRPCLKELIRYKYKFRFLLYH